MAGPLTGIRVLDLSRILAGPWATQTLADLGAEVIKIERPGRGDDTRTWGPPYATGDDEKSDRESAYFLGANRGKQSLAIDITSPEGADILRRLAEQADVLVENFKVGGLKKYQLDYDSLKSVNPRLIYCSITGFGQDGPYAHRPGYDFMLQGMGGLMSITGEPDDVPGGGPVKVGVATVDLYTGLYSVIGILAALREREQTGKGCHIDMALMDVQVAVLANQSMNYLVSGKAPGRMGNAHPNIVPYQAFKTADGHLILAIGNDSQFSNFCTAATRKELAQDNRFATNPARVENRDRLVPIVADIMLTKTTAEWISLLEDAGVPCGPINDVGQVFENEQVKSRQLQLSLQHSSVGEVPSVSNPIRIDGEQLEQAKAPPSLGEHTDRALQSWLGISEQQLATLRKTGVIG